jgi:hypothetical protein
VVDAAFAGTGVVAGPTGVGGVDVAPLSAVPTEVDDVESATVGEVQIVADVDDVESATVREA